MATAKASVPTLPPRPENSLQNLQALKLTVNSTQAPQQKLLPVVLSLLGDDIERAPSGGLHSLSHWEALQVSRSCDLQGRSKEEP